MTRLASAVFAAAISLAGGVALAADDAPATGSGDHMSGFRQACGTDLQTYCASSTTRDERRACVQANKDKFSEGCKSYMAAHPRPQSSTPPAGQ
jgi:hypothetical protein